MSRAARIGLLVALAGGAFGTALVAPRIAAAQSRLVVDLPFQGEVSDELRDEVERQVRGAVLARGERSPEASTVRGSLGVDVPTDPQAIVGFGRGMGAQFVITGSITPLTGQYTLVLRLYDVATGHFAEQRRNVASGDEPEAIPSMVAGLFAPGAIQPSPEELAQQEAERRRQEDERVRAEHDAEAQRQQAEAARRQQEEAQRRREEEERNRNLRRWDRGGPFGVGAGLLLGARVSSTQARPPGAPQAESFLAGLRIDGAYAVVPSIGLEAGLSALVLGSPTNALAIGATARVNVPTSTTLPVGASAGVAAGVFHALTGSQTTSAWLSFDARGQVAVSSGVSLYAGAQLDVIPGLFVSVAGTVGATVRFGDSATPTPQSPPPDDGATPGNSAGPGSGAGDGTPAPNP